MSGLRVCRTIYESPSDWIFDPKISDHCINLHIANPGNLERRLERRLDGDKTSERLTYPGTFTFVPAFRESEWLWEGEVEILEIYLPSGILETIAMEDCAYTSHSITLIDRFAIRDLLLEQLVLTFYAELERNNSNNSLYLESLQNLIAVHLLQHHCSVRVSDTSISGGLSKSKLRQVIEYIQANLDRDLSLIELAELAQLSSHHFGKVFKQSMGVSPHQYVLQHRLEKARQLLSNTQISIAEIGQLVGFYDQSHFSNIFRRYTNLTPRQYRNQF